MECLVLCGLRNPIWSQLKSVRQSRLGKKGKNEKLSVREEDFRLKGTNERWCSVVIRIRGVCLR